MEDIIGHRLKKREIKLCVKWLGYNKPTYEPFVQFAQDSPEILKMYLIKAIEKTSLLKKDSELLITEK